MRIPDTTPGTAGRQRRDVSTAAAGSPSCERCGSTGFEMVAVPGEITRVRRCSCSSQGQRERLLSAARVPRRHQGCLFENFDELNDSLRLAKLQVRKFVDDYPIHDFGLLLLGPCGRGKTHLATAALLSLIREKGVKGLFYDFRDLLKEIQASYNTVSGTTELAILQPVFAAEVLVLDDLGATKMTDWVRDTLSHIINNRYNDRRVTIFTSNLEDETVRAPIADERVRDKPSLRDRIGDALRSRLYEMCETVYVKSDKDFRVDVKKHTGRRPGPLD